MYSSPVSAVLAGVPMTEWEPPEEAPKVDIEFEAKIARNAQPFHHTGSFAPVTPDPPTSTHQGKYVPPQITPQSYVRSFVF